MSTLKIPFIFLSILIFSACKIEPQAITYGKDQCHYCKMNIVDKQHAAQYVTKKGKQFKFDAIECMVNKIAEIGENDLAILLVSDYGKSAMTEAHTASYLISPEIKSPMGAFLSAFSNVNKAEETKKQHTGKTYTWDELKRQLAKAKK